MPKDPGGLVVRVRDQANQPIQGAWVYVGMPNHVGSTFQEGTATRADGLSREVDVVKGRTVTIAFVLTRS